MAVDGYVPWVQQPSDRGHRYTTPYQRHKFITNSQVDVPHIAYACIGIFCTLFSLASLFVKEKLYIGEATVASIVGLILGPHCLDWFNPLSWGNVDQITLEICRIVLCIQIVAVAVELPRKYMKKHWLSVAILLLPVMTVGWIVVGLFIWVLIPHFDFPSSLLVSACVTATDPVLAAAVVGKGKFAERVPGHLRNLLTAESGCNDGMAFPFIYLSLYMITYLGHPGEIIKHWFTLTILWECFFGVILGVVIGYLLRKALFYAEKWNLIDRESFLALFVFLALICAGVGSMLGVDDLLVSFAAGTAFGWNGDFAKKTEESHVSTVIDLLLNLTFFVYFGSIIPWAEFNDGSLGLNVWRLIILAIVIIFLRRIPAVLALKPWTPDIKTWREALFCGHFGPIGVGAIFASILARKELEDHYTTEETPLEHLPDINFPHYQLIVAIWPMVCFIVITSIIVHGSSVAVLALGRRLNRMALTITLTTTNTHDQGPSWMSRLQKLDHASSSFSLHRIDTNLTATYEPSLGNRTSTIETSGVKVRPAGGARRKRMKKKQAQSKRSKPAEFSRSATVERQRPATEFLQLGRDNSIAPSQKEDDDIYATEPSSFSNNPLTSQVQSSPETKQEYESSISSERRSMKLVQSKQQDDVAGEAAAIYEEGLKVILENAQGEVLQVINTNDNGQEDDVDNVDGSGDDHAAHDALDMSIHSMGSLRRHMSNYSVLSEKSDDHESTHTLSRRKTLVRKDSRGRGKRYYAHQVDDILFVENQDGEIVRKYRLNRHRAKSKPRSGLIVQRALSMVGLRNKEKEREREKAQDPVCAVVDSASSVTPGPESPTASIALKEPDSRLTQRVNELLSGAAQSNTKKVSQGARRGDNSEKGETEVERRRRLAALGRIDADRDEEDEEKW